ncbi:MAG: hypothetical protein ACRD9R_15225 [Pyrinomonadaceae bacterium]
MSTRLQQINRQLARLLLAVMGVGAAFGVAVAQSSELDAPTPVVSSVVEGRVAPLDVGDARVTRHFYTFGGARGDLVVSVESDNLDGDIDLFTAGTLRPLTKITVYSGTGTLRASKSVFLRRDETLILRVQARSPNDQDGVYRITLTGTFVASNLPAPAAPEAAIAPAPSSPAGKVVRRVNSAGARIEEPRPPEPVRIESAEEVESEGKEETPKATKDATKTSASRRTETGARPPADPRPPARRGRRGRVRPAAKTEPERAETPAAVERTRKGESEADAGETSSEAPAPKPARPKSSRPKREAPRRTDPARARMSEASRDATAAAAPAPEPLPGTRLVIQLKDGTRIEREMNAVRRVTVEKGLLLVVLNNGKIERQPMSGVLRMAIEP